MLEHSTCIGKEQPKRSGKLEKDIVHSTEKEENQRHPETLSNLQTFRISRTMGRQRQEAGGSSNHIARQLNRKKPRLRQVHELTLHTSINKQRI